MANWKEEAKKIRAEYEAEVLYGIALLNKHRESEGVPIYWDVLFNQHSLQASFDEGVRQGAVYVGQRARNVFEAAAGKANVKIQKEKTHRDYAEQQQAAERLMRKQAHREANQVKVWKAGKDDPDYFESFEAAKKGFIQESGSSGIPRTNLRKWTKWEGPEAEWLVKKRYGELRDKNNYFSKKAQKDPTLEVSKQKTYESILQKMKK